MKLATRLFLSHLIVVLISIALLGILTTRLAPAAFEIRNEVETIQINGNEQLESNTSSDRSSLDASITEAVITALLIAGGVAVIVAAGISWAISRRIVRPIRAVVDASQYIAGGHYEQRLDVHTHDELGDLSHQFNQMAAALATIENTRRQLLADVSHELKTPLASIKGYMEGLQDGIVAPTPETFHLLYCEADRLQRLVHDLQELSHIEAGLPELNLKPHSANALIESVVARLVLQYQSKGIQLCTQIPPTPVMVLADFDRIGQVLLNLLGNALQYTSSGGMVSICLNPENGRAHFSISDTGIGLAAEDRERIFQRFYRVDKSRARSSGGSGIGLTIARHLVERHRGQLWAESEGISKGSTFHFTLQMA